MKLNSAYLTMYLGRTRCIVRHTLHQAHARHPASGSRQPSAVVHIEPSSASIRRCGFLFLSATRTRGDNMRRYKEVWPRSTYLPSFLPEMEIAWTALDEDQAHPIHHQFLEISRFRSRPSSFEFRVSTARLSFWATYIAFFIFVQAMLILRLRLSGSAV